MGIFEHSSHPPPLHIRFDLEEISQVNAPWPARRCLQHEAPKFRVESRENFTATEQSAMLEMLPQRDW